MTTPTIEELNEWGRRLAVALMASVDYSVVKPLDLERRTKSAIVVAASKDHYSGMLAKAMDKLQIEKLRPGARHDLFAIGAEIGDRYDAFARHVEAEASVLVAMASEFRSANRAAAEALRKEAEESAEEIA